MTFETKAGERHNILFISFMVGLLVAGVVELIRFWSFYPARQPSSDALHIFLVFIISFAGVNTWHGLDSLLTWQAHSRAERAWKRLEERKFALQLGQLQTSIQAPAQPESNSQVYWERYLFQQGGKLYFRHESQMALREAAWRWVFINVLKYMERAGKGTISVLVGEGGGFPFDKEWMWNKVMPVMDSNALVRVKNGVDTVLADKWEGSYTRAIEFLELARPISFPPEDPPEVKEFVLRA